MFQSLIFQYLIQYSLLSLCFNGKFKIHKKNCNYFIIRTFQCNFLQIIDCQNIQKVFKRIFYVNFKLKNSKKMLKTKSQILRKIFLETFICIPIYTIQQKFFNFCTGSFKTLIYL